MELGAFDRVHANIDGAWHIQIGIISKCDLVVLVSSLGAELIVEQGGLVIGGVRGDEEISISKERYELDLELLHIVKVKIRIQNAVVNISSLVSDIGILFVRSDVLDLWNLHLEEEHEVSGFSLH